MLTCKEVSDLIGSDALAGASWRTRAGVWLHLRMCQYCRAYQRSIAALGAWARELGAADPVPQEAVERLRRAIRESAGE